MADVPRQPDSAAEPLDPVLVEGALYFRPDETNTGAAEAAEAAEGTRQSGEQRRELDRQRPHQQRQYQDPRNLPAGEGSGGDVAHGEGRWAFRSSPTGEGSSSDVTDSSVTTTGERQELGIRSAQEDLGVRLPAINVRRTPHDDPIGSVHSQESASAAGLVELPRIGYGTNPSDASSAVRLQPLPRPQSSNEGLRSWSAANGASAIRADSLTATTTADSSAVYQRAAAKLVAFGFNGTKMNDHARRLIAMGAGAVILFARNFSSPRQLAALCTDLKRAAFPRRLLLMVDQEGGRVTRLGPPFTHIPAARTLGVTRNPNLARAAGRVLGRELRSVHIDIDLAPVLDVDTNPNNPVIGERSFSRDPGVVSQMAYELIRGMQSEGVAACVKHYPGHGDTSVDSHLALPYSPHDLARLESVELVPFARAAVDADVAAVMVAHVAVPALATWQPAPSMEDLPERVRRSMSPRWGEMYSPHSRRRHWDEARREAEVTLGLSTSGLPASGLPRSHSDSDLTNRLSSNSGWSSSGRRKASHASPSPFHREPHQQHHSPPNHTPPPPSNQPPPPIPSPLAAFGPSPPATLSPGALAYLRMEVGFEGAVLSDCLEMGAIVKHLGVGEAAVLAVAAGVDVVLVCHTEARQVEAVNALARALESGRVSAGRFRAASRAVDALARGFWRAPPPEGSEMEERYWEEEQRVVGCREHGEVVREIEHQALVWGGEGEDGEGKGEGRGRCSIS